MKQRAKGVPERKDSGLPKGAGVTGETPKSASQAHRQQDAASEPPGEPVREDLHHLINDLPPEHLDAARKFLRWLIHESREGLPAATPSLGSDAEVEAAGDAFITQDKSALARLAK
ncbi:MAG TPA: hypothetical protein VGK74_10655 [Symbiobacteriaceae bacterium]